MSAPPTDSQEREALAGEYVLGTLTLAQREQVVRWMQSDAALAQAVAAWEHRLLPLSTLAEPLPPPPRLWRRIESSLNLAPLGTQGRTGWQAVWNHLALWRSLAAGGLTAAVVLASLMLGTESAPTPRFLVVLVTPQDRSPGWVVQAHDTRQVSLIPLGRTDVPTDKALEFWTKAEGWSGPVSLGLVKPGQRVQIPLDKLPALQANQLFELTLEPATGSPIGKPTGPIQFIGRAVPVI